MLEGRLLNAFDWDQRGLTGDYLRGILRLESRLIIYLDVEHLLTSSERIALSQAGAEALAHE